MGTEVLQIAIAGQFGPAVRCGVHPTADRLPASRLFCGLRAIWHLSLAILQRDQEGIDHK